MIVFVIEAKIRALPIYLVNALCLEARDKRSYDLLSVASEITLFTEKTMVPDYFYVKKNIH